MSFLTRSFYVLTLVCSMQLMAQKSDSIKVYWLDPVEITAKRIDFGSNQLTLQRDNLDNLLAVGGFSLIKKGVFFAQDIYADGLKKGDISIVIDGERYPPACPNRMDSPVARLNPLDMESISLVKNSVNLQSGLGGLVSFHRSEPSAQPALSGSFAGMAGASTVFDLSLRGGTKENQLSLHYANGSPFTNGDGKSFTDLYGYSDNYKFTLGEVSLQGTAQALKYGASFSYTENITFPYLQMDERFNRLFSANISWKGNKIYANYTSHVMNNSLRTSTMFMETDAKNLTIGVTGGFYEAYFRKWTADNVIKMPVSQMMPTGMTINNAMLPGVNQYFASVYHKIDVADFTFSGKAGLSYYNMDKEEVVSFYKNLYSDPKTTAFFPVIGFSAAYSKAISSTWGFGAMLEASSEVPETEALFIAVKRAPSSSSWVGNPTLLQPLKTGLRASLTTAFARLELFSTLISNYVYLDKKKTGSTNFVTYRNISAMMLGANLVLEYKFIEVTASYTNAENRSDETPLAEIPPLKVSTRIASPQWMDMALYLRHTYSDAQSRVDLNLGETSTPAYNKLDLGLAGKYQGIQFSVEVENLLNANYYSHLSYFRDPFKSGMKVYEPGTTVRLNIGYGL
ncbi:TonB-dependent receptor [Ignavibacteriales bacterium]